MAQPAKPANWEKNSPTWWSSALGFILEKDGLWTAHAYRNQRTGVAWTELRRGFATAAAAKKWIERTAEE